MKTSPPLRMALDTNLILRMWPRRYLAATIAASGNRVVLPQTAMELAMQRYDMVSTGADHRIAVERWSHVNDPAIQNDPSQFSVFLARTALARMCAFARWLRDETHRAPQAWEIAPRTEHSKATATFLRTSGALDDPDDGRYAGTGEGAQILGEAIESGCVSIGPSFYKPSNRRTLDRWLHRHGQSLDPDVPLTVRPDDAVALVLPEADGRLLAQIAYAVVHDPGGGADRYEREAQNLERLQNALATDDLKRTAIQIATYAANRRGLWSGARRQARTRS